MAYGDRCRKCRMEKLILDEEIRRGTCYKCNLTKYLILSASLIFIMVIFGVIYGVYWLYPIDRDVWDVLDRAQITAESDDMFELVNQAIKGLEERGQHKGHCALVFKKPSNSLDAQYLALKNIRTRLERTNKFDKSSVEYQSAIDDMRGTIRELPYDYCWIWHFD